MLVKYLKRGYAGSHTGSLAPHGTEKSLAAMGPKSKCKLKMCSARGLQLLGLFVLLNIIPQAKAACGKPIAVQHSSLHPQFARQTSFENGQTATFRCNTGYSVKGRTYSIKCLQNEWSPVQFSCEPKNCGFPGESEHGYWDGEAFTFGKDVRFVCNDGYVIAGRQDYRTCQADGTWSHEVPVCEPIKCDTPEEVENGIVSFPSELDYDSIVTYHCNQGFSLIGNKIRRCNEKGVWSDSAPACKDIKCPRPPPVKNGYAVEDVKTEYIMNDKLVYQCEGHYDLKGSPTITCLQSKLWSEPPICEPVCKEKTIPNANSNEGYEREFFVLGNQLQFTCKTGFADKRRDMLSTTCTLYENKADWFPLLNTFKCEKLCPLFPTNNYQDTRLEYVLGFPTGKRFFLYDYVEFKCAEGYRDISKTSSDAFKVHCLPTSNWDPSPVWKQKTFSCRRYCGHPGTPGHGQTIGSSYIEGATLRFKCDLGFRINGQQQVYTQCRNNGMWSVPKVDCQEVNCGRPEITNGICSGQHPSHFAHDKSVSCQCNTGYELTTSNNAIRCQDDGRWTYLHCEVVTCNYPNEISNLIYKAPSNIFGETITFTCRSGYELEGFASAVCQANKQWSHPAPKCIQKKCKKITLSENLKIDDTNVNVGSQVNFYCDEGYTLIGSNEAECLPTLEWSIEKAPICKPVTCDQLDIQNGSFDVSLPVQFNTFIRYSCNENYVLVGNQTIECLRTGKLSSEKPYCKMADTCDNPSSVENAEPIIHNRDFKAGVTVEYKCKRGFSSANEGPLNTINCQKSPEGHFKWTEPTINCTPITCEPPEVVDNAKLVGDEVTFGKTITYVCKTGFTIKGNDTRECLADGTWSNITPTCERESIGQPCERLGNISKGHVHVNQTNPNIAKYACDDGYVLEGPSVRTCKNNKWSGLEPICRVRLSTVLSSNECGTPPMIDNADLTQDVFGKSSFKIGTNINYNCKPGYTTSSGSVSISIRCRSMDDRGKWNIPVSTCNEACQIPGNIENGEVVVDNSNPRRIVYLCNEGYILFGNNMRTCSNLGKWSGKEPSCRIAGNDVCGTPPNIPNAMLIEEHEQQESFPVDTRVRYRCKPGYTVSPGSSYTLYCRREGNAIKWDMPKLKCSPKTCSFPGEIENGYFEGDSFQYRRIVTYFCNKGYTIPEKHTSLECQADGTWSHQTPTCEPITCDSPAEGPHLISSSPSRLEFGSAITYTCEKEMTLNGPSTRTCQADGTWSGKDPVCVFNCPPPSEPWQGYWIGNDHSLGSSITLKCNKGYMVAGADKQTCREDQAWYPSQSPTCQRTCDQPIDPFGRLSDQHKSKNVFTQGDIVRVTCSNRQPYEGYNLQCNDGQWAPPGSPRAFTWNTCGGFCLMPPSQVKATLSPRFTYKNMYNVDDYLYFNCNNSYSRRFGYYLYCRQDNTKRTNWENDCGSGPCCL
ncbi:sushi, von Willebrand factor type A, EGF and pentraxin domain-containing protein 1-like isoform X1 [Lethenteron reissneri]|uniref:sushi, von Willebrand factor type A, EGF and pentraxin domain-containing protein 1-like isoform X1 n=1 Tax=Lethenteron reissneri TaxID=7753 RepID=UPI002AB5F2DD|nr:sushi, von Willebrand factor type A, EGF and pentraxin domain-containing protein 1-like isoform X1 [Lethenteron reissneri]